MEISEIHRIYCANENKFDEKLFDSVSSKNELYLYAENIVESRKLSDYPFCAEIIVYLFEDSDQFSKLLKGFLLLGLQFDLFQIIYQKIDGNPDISYRLFMRSIDVPDAKCIVPGIILSGTVDKYAEAREWFESNLKSGNDVYKRCLLKTLELLFKLQYNEEQSDYFVGLAENIDDSYILLDSWGYFFILHKLFQIDPDRFENRVISKICDKNTAKSYISVINRDGVFSQKGLEKALSILEKESPLDWDLEEGLVKLYSQNPGFVVDIFRNRLQLWKSTNIFPEGHLESFKEIGITPILEMIEEEIDKGNVLAILMCSYNFITLFSNIQEAVDWCEKWKKDPKKRISVLELLRLIISGNLEKTIDKSINSAIGIVIEIAKEYNIDYNKSTKHINKTSDPSINDEDKLKGLCGIDIIFDRINREKIDIEQLKINLNNAPSVKKYLSESYLIESAESEEPHPFAYLFSHKPKDGTALTPEQSYWELVFKRLDEKSIINSKKKRELKDITNILSTLVEFNIFFKLLDKFDIEVEPSIPELIGKKLEAKLTHKSSGESAYLEIFMLEEPIEAKYSPGGFYSTKPKLKYSLNAKFKKQFGKGEIDLSLPLIVIADYRYQIDFNMYADSLYGESYCAAKVYPDKGYVEEGIKRKSDGFFKISGTDVISAIAVLYKPEFGGVSLYNGAIHSHPNPKHPLSPKTWIDLRDLLYGDNARKSIRSLDIIDGIDEEKAELLYSNGIDSIYYLALVDLSHYSIDGISSEELKYFQDEARRMLSAKSSDSIKCLKDINPDIILILKENGIERITQLRAVDKPDEIQGSDWEPLIEEAENIFNL